MLSKSSPKLEYLYLLQLSFVAWVSIVFGCNAIGPYYEAPRRVARFLTYVVTANVAEEIIRVALPLPTLLGLSQVFRDCRTSLVLLVTTVAALLCSGNTLFDADFLFLTVARLLVKYLEASDRASMGESAAGARTVSISYGSGMACSFFEGYLRKIIPPNESDYAGFQGAIRTYESTQKVHFPVKRLFLVITKSLHCPTNLDYFNKEHRPDLPRLEACSSLEDVTRNVAGVQQRVYRNSAYQIQRRGKPPVYLAVECATPLHTLHQVVTNRDLYDELLHVDPDEIREDFCDMLSKILRKSPDCRDKCELVDYDDTDPEQNLADLLLDRIQQLENNFEHLIQEAQLLHQ